MNLKLTTLFFPLLLACPDGKTVSIIENVAPEATITIPTAGAELQDGTNLFAGTVSDQDNDLAELSVSWYVGDSLDAVEGCDSIAPTTAEVDCQIPLSEGDTTVRLQVTDPAEETGTASVSFVVAC